jgi:DNA-binding response OmpR family regulator
MARVRLKVLVVDDDATLRGVLKRLLETEGHAVVQAGSAAEGLLTAQDSRPDIVLADIEMPGMNGFELCRVLKRDERTRSIPVILLTGAFKDDEDVVTGVSEGADDYLLKPVSGKLLAAKMTAVLRRYDAPKELDSMLRSGGLALDVAGRTVTVKGKRVALTRKEFDLLTTFLRQPGRVLKFNYLLETVWGYDPATYNDPHTVEVHVSSLRRKLGPETGTKIVNVPTLGYRFEG